RKDADDDDHDQQLYERESFPRRKHSHCRTVATRRGRRHIATALSSNACVSVRLLLTRARHYARKRRCGVCGKRSESRAVAHVDTAELRGRKRLVRRRGDPALTTAEADAGDRDTLR